jgi:hypothetical protein
LEGVDMISLTTEQKGELWQLAHSYCFIWSGMKYCKDRFLQQRTHGYQFSENSILEDQLIEKSTIRVVEILENNTNLLEEFFLFYISTLCSLDDPEDEFTTKVTEQSQKYYWEKVRQSRDSEGDKDETYTRLLSDMTSRRLTINFVFKAK